MTDTMPRHDFGEAAQAYAQAFTALSPSSLDVLCGLVSPSVRFKDPFNDVRGRERFHKIFVHMFETVTDPKFVVDDIALVEDRAYLRWRFSFCPKGSEAKAQRLWRIDGMSAITFDADGLVAEHIDYWDASEQFYEKLPIIGAILRLIKKKLSVEAEYS